MTRFEVRLEILLNGSSAGSTCDVVEAASPSEAEELAMEAWKEARPDRSFRPLLTTAVAADEA